jgi:hypothetical protein
VLGEDGTNSVEADVTVEVLDVNEAPLIEDQTFLAIGENSMVGSVAGIVQADDPEDQPITFAIVGGSGAAYFQIDPAMGVVTVSDSSGLDFETAASFDLIVEVTDSGDPAKSAQATITIPLDDVNEPGADFMLTNDTIVVSGLDPVTVGDFLVVGDPDDSETFDAYAFELVAGAGDTDNASFQIVAGNQLQFLPGGGAQETYSIRVQGTDGVHPLEAKSFLIHATVGNQPPVIDVANHITSTGLDQPLEIDVIALGLAHDVDGQVVSVTIVTPPAHGTAVAVGGVITYTPAAGYTGMDDFQYTVQDNLGADSNPGVVTIDVQSGNGWHNAEEAEDVDGQGGVTILDLLTVVQFLRDHHVGIQLSSLPVPNDPNNQMVDVKPDGVCDIQDVLLIVQHLREPPPAGEPEGESFTPLLADHDDDRWEQVLDEVADDVSQAWS